MPTGHGKLRLQVSLYASPNPPNCVILGPNARATIDGLPLELKSSGGPASGTEISGVEIPPSRPCSDMAYFMGVDLEELPAGTASVVRVEDGPRFAEITVPNLRAAFGVEIDRPEAAVGDTVTLQVTPRGDPPLPVARGDWGVVFYGTGKTGADAKNFVRNGRSISFTVPQVPPGQYRVVLYASDGPLPSTRCVGVSKCEASRLGGPGGTTLNIR
jgi:hypothetical protein